MLLCICGNPSHADHHKGTKTQRPHCPGLRSGNSELPLQQLRCISIYIRRTLPKNVEVTAPMIRVDFGIDDGHIIVNEAWRGCSTAFDSIWENFLLRLYREALTYYD